MENLADAITGREVLSNQLAIYWLCQAGFAFKTASGQVVYIDPYLSDVVERIVGFKRMMACPIAAEQVRAELVICTHEHLDHMDVDAIPVLARNSATHFAGPVECMKEFEKIGIPRERCHLLEEGKTVSVGGTSIHAVYADHGELSEDALGVILDFGGISVYHTGDTAYRPGEFMPAVNMHADVLLPCINGIYGNMNAVEAAKLTLLVKPQVVIPTHFWMFVEQNGNPGEFLEMCRKLVPQTNAVLMNPGGEYIFTQAG